MKKILLNTNRVLIKVTPQAEFRKLKIKCFPECINQSLEQFSLFSGFYLINKPFNSLTPTITVEEELKRFSNKIFAQELSEMGIPVMHWPNIEDYQVFREFLDVEFLDLIADFGDGCIENHKTLLE